MIFLVVVGSNNDNVNKKYSIIKNGTTPVQQQQFNTNNCIIYVAHHHWSPLSSAHHQYQPGDVIAIFTSITTNITNFIIRYICIVASYLYDEDITVTNNIIITVTSSITNITDITINNVSLTIDIIINIIEWLL